MAGGSLYVAGTDNITGDIEVFSAAASANPVFSHHSTAMTGLINSNAELFNNGTSLCLIAVPYDNAIEKKNLIYSGYIGSSWSPARRISSGGYSGANWWEFSPIGYNDGFDSYVIFSMESEGTTYSDAEIAFIKLNWDLANDHDFHIQNAINLAADNDQINVSAGEYYENQIVIDKPVNITGAGLAATIIDGSSVTGLPGSGLIRIIAPGNVTFSGFTLRKAGSVNGSDRFGIYANSSVPGFEYNINNNRIIGTNDPNDAGDYGVYASSGHESFKFIQNEISGTGANPMLVELHEGPIEISENSLDVGVWGCDAIFIMTYGGLDISTLQKISGNSINAGTGGPFDYDHRASGITFASAYTGTQGRFLNIQITDNTVYNLNSNRRGIGLWNNAPAGSGSIGDIVNPVIARNTITGVPGADQSLGIRLLGQISNASIINNYIDGAAVGFRGQIWNGHIALNSNIYSNSFTNNTLNLEWQGAAAINASDNWWGINTPSGVASLVSPLVDYTPWLYSGFDTDPGTNGFQGDLAILYVDDNSSQTGSISRIQEAINQVTGTSVLIAPGNYIEQVVVTKPGLVLTGAGSHSDPLTNTIIQSPTSLTYYFRTSLNNYPIIGFDGIASGSIQNCRIDGAGRGNSNYRFVGIGFWNAGGSVSNCIITGIQDTPFSGSQHGNGIYTYNNTGGPYVINVDNTGIYDCQKNGMTLSGNGMTANVSNCLVVGHGPTTITAQNGIQISNGAIGTIIDSEISGINYTGSQNASASGVLLYYPPGAVTLSGNSIHDCQGALNAYFASSLNIVGNTFNLNGFAFIWGGIGTIVNGNTFTNSDQALYVSDDTNAVFSNNVLNTNNYGIIADGACLNQNYTGNTITGNMATGIVVQPYDIYEPAGMSFRANNISGNASGLENATSNLIDATGNWWGDVQGPLVSTLRSGNNLRVRPNWISRMDGSPEDKPNLAERSLLQSASESGISKQKISASASTSRGASGNTIASILTNGDGISGLIDYSPWWGANYVGDPHSSPWGWWMNPSNASNIQESINSASSGDSILVLPETYSGTGNFNIDFGGKNLRLFGADSIENVIIDCQHAGRAFHFHSGESSSAMVKGFTIKNGSATGNGGAILIENSSSPQILHSLIIQNRASGNGGAICISNSSPSIRNNTILWNRSTGDGGGLYIANSSPIVLHTIIWQDTGSVGNEIAASGGSPSITYSDIDGGWPGEGNIDCDPNFCDPENGNFYISDLSCCLNSGIGGNNIGAFELGCTGDFIPGDANASGTVNGLDVVYMVNYFKDTGPPIPAPIWRADANGNCMVNGLDVVYMVNFFKGSGNGPIDGDCFGSGVSSSSQSESR